MSLKAMYEQTADNYDIANRFGAVSESHRIALEQIKKFNLGYKPHYKVLDLGVGNGAFLSKLQQIIPNSEFTGIDVSPDILKKAKHSVPFHAIEGSVVDASIYVPNHSQDLLLAHFINAYVPINILFDEAKKLTRSNGHFSMITTTYDSFPTAQQQLAEFIAEEGILSSLVGHYYKSLVNNTTVAASREALLSTFEQNQFELLEHYRLKIPITLNDIDELCVFGLEGTWFLNSLSVSILPKYFLLQRIKRLFSKIFTFPYHDTHVIDIVLARK